MSFTWSNGSRLYYSNLTSNFHGDEGVHVQGLRGDRGLARRRRRGRRERRPWRVERPGDRPRKQSSAPASPTRRRSGPTTRARARIFGNVYTCYTTSGRSPVRPSRSSLRARPTAVSSFQKAYAPEPCLQLECEPGPAGLRGAHRQQGQRLRRLGGHGQEAERLPDAVSIDGGKTFGKPKTIADVTDVGHLRRRALDLVRRDRRREDELIPEPRHRQRSADRQWRAGHDRARLVRWQRWRSTTKRRSCSCRATVARPGRTRRQVEASGRPPDFAFIGISPDGDRPVRRSTTRSSIRSATDTISPRASRACTRHSTSTGRPSATTTLYRGAIGDARRVECERTDRRVHRRLQHGRATNDGAIAVFNDARNAAVCRRSTRSGRRSSTGPRARLPLPPPTARRPSATPTSSRRRLPTRPPRGGHQASSGPDPRPAGRGWGSSAARSGSARAVLGGQSGPCRRGSGCGLRG